MTTGLSSWKASLPMLILIGLSLAKLPISSSFIYYLVIFISPSTITSSSFTSFFESLFSIFYYNVDCLFSSLSFVLLGWMGSLLCRRVNSAFVIVPSASDFNSWTFSTSFQFIFIFYSLTGSDWCMSGLDYSLCFCSAYFIYCFGYDSVCFCNCWRDGSLSSFIYD